MTRDQEKALQNLKKNLQILEERISQYVYETDVPLQDIRERERLKKRILSMELQLQQGFSEKQDIIEIANTYLFTLDNIAQQLSKFGWSENTIIELDQWAVSIEVNRDEYKKMEFVEDTKNDTALKKKQTLLLLLRQVGRVIEKYEQVTNYLETHPVSSTNAYSRIISPALFTDREEFLQNLSTNFDDYNMFVIAGVGGIGKTYLVKQFVSSLKDYQTIWINCTPELTVEQFFFTIGEILTKDYGILTINGNLKDKGRLTENKIALLVHQLDQYSICIIIDDFHTANDQFESLVNLMAKYIEKFKIFILTRRLSQSLRNIYYITYIEKLSGIGISQVQYYLSQYRLHIKAEMVKPIYEVTAGHPLALRLFSSLCVVDRYTPEELLNEFADVFGRNLEFELIAKIYDELEQDEKDLLSKFSVYRIPVRREAIDYILDNNTQMVLNSLLHRFLITEPIENEFLTHDLIREFFYDQLDKKISAHLQAAQYYLSFYQKIGNLDDGLESYYHFYNAEEYTEALKIVLNIIPQLNTEAKFELVLELIHQMELVLDIPPELLIQRARIWETWGKWDEAVDLLNQLIQEPSIPPETLLSALNTILQIYEQRGDYEEGLSLFEKYHLVASPGSTPELAHLYYRTGRFYNELGNYEKTIEYYHQSLKISTALNDRPNIARTNRSIGVTQWFFGHYDEALEQLNKTLIICQEDNNQRELSDTLKHIATVWTRKHEYEKALKPFQESIKICRRIGYKHGLAWNLLGVAEACIPLGRLDEAEDNLNQALAIFNQLSEKNGVVRSTYPFATIYMKRGELDKAVEICEKSLILAQELNSLTAEGEVLEATLEVYKTLNQKEKSLEVLARAIEIYKLIGSQRLVILEAELNSTK